MNATEMISLLESWFLPTVSVTFWSDLRFGCFCFCSWVAGVLIPAHLLHNQASSQQSAGGLLLQLRSRLQGWNRTCKSRTSTVGLKPRSAPECLLNNLQEVQLIVIFLETRHLVAAFEADAGTGIKQSAKSVNGANVFSKRTLTYSWKYQAQPVFFSTRLAACT
jgi:hypothetical protein